MLGNLPTTKPEMHEAYLANATAYEPGDLKSAANLKTGAWKP
jgi:hypothetical protein